MGRAKIEVLWIEEDTNLPYYVARRCGKFFVDYCVWESEYKPREECVRDDVKRRGGMTRYLISESSKELLEAGMPEELLREIQAQLALESL